MVISLEYTDIPEAVSTRILYRYAVDAASPESSKDVAVGLGWLISEYAAVVVRRSILKRTIPVAVLVHDKWTCEEEVAVPCNVGAGGNGTPGVVAEVSPEYEDSAPLAPSDLIRYVYVVLG